MSYVYHFCKKNLLIIALFISHVAFGNNPSVNSFTFVDSTGHDSLAPTITFFAPTSGHRGDTILIVGTHFTGTTSLAFGSTAAASFFTLNDSTILAIVGSGSSGNVSLNTPFGFATKPGFTFINDSTGHDTLTPVIRLFTPTSGRRGTRVTIFGLHLRGTTVVRFGGIAADSIRVLSDTAIFANVGAGASGNVSVTTPFGTASKPGFTFISDTIRRDTPVIRFFTPTSGHRGDSILIRGIHFTKTIAVAFGGTVAASYTTLNDSTIIATVGTGSSGSVLVITSSGAASKPGFTFISDTIHRDTPVIRSFTPTSGHKGDSILIRGAHFTGTSAVAFGGTIAATYATLNDSTIIAVVGSGSSGSVLVITPAGAATKPGFTFISDSTGHDTTFIRSFTPTSGHRGDSILIRGTHFAGTSAVSFGGTAAASFYTLNDSTIIAIVDSGSTGNVSVTDSFGTATKPGFTFISDSTGHDTTFMLARAGATTMNENSAVNSLFRTYPNPASTYTMATIPSSTHHAQLQLVDINGRIVKTISVGNKAQQIKVDLDGLITGVYKLVWSDGTKTITRTILVKK